MPKIVPQLLIFSVLLFTMITAASCLEAYMKEAVFLPELRTAEQYRAYDDWGVINAEYLPFATFRSVEYTGEPEAVGEAVSISADDRRGVNAEIDVQNNGAEAGAVIVPRLYYTGYTAQDDAGQAHRVYETENGLLAVDVPAYFSGTIYVRYREKPLWRAAEIVSALTAAALIVLYLRFRRKYGPVTAIDAPACDLTAADVQADGAGAQ